jgi:anti-sigma B factor antagonist
MEQQYPQPDKPHVVVLCLHGDMIRHEEAPFELLVDEILDKGQRNFVLDFHNIGFVDSAGIGLIIKLAAEIEKRLGSLRLCNPKTNVKNVFATLGIDNRFHIYHSLTDALQSVGHLLSVEFINFKFK